jgi:hypothetical protein
VASKPPLGPNIGVGEKRLILKIPDVFLRLYDYYKFQNVNVNVNINVGY